MTPVFESPAHSGEEQKSTVFSEKTMGEVVAVFYGPECRENAEEFCAAYSPSKAVAVAKPKKAAKRFVKPDTDDVAAYFHIKGVISYQEEAEVFCDHFESNGWKIGGKGPMKCWRAAVRNWIRRLDKGVFAAPEKTGMNGAGVNAPALFDESADDMLSFMRTITTKVELSGPGGEVQGQLTLEHQP